jgi:hypothetical protein
MDVNQFIQNVISGNAVEAKESLNDILSSRAFTSLDEYKKEIAQKLYATEEDIEVQDTADSPVEEIGESSDGYEVKQSKTDPDVHHVHYKGKKIGYVYGNKKGMWGHEYEPMGTGDHGHSSKKEAVNAVKDDHLHHLNMKEEVEQIDELKKSTLGSYVKKASRNLANQSFDHGEDEHRQYGDPEDTEREADMKKRERDIENRQKGINRAASKLSKEEVEQIDEVGDTPAGKKMLGSYLKKRTKQLPAIERNYQMTPYEDGPMGAKTIKKFQKKVNKGMGRAIDRLTK